MQADLQKQIRNPSRIWRNTAESGGKIGYSKLFLLYRVDYPYN